MKEQAKAQLKDALCALGLSRFAESQILVEQGPVYLQFLRRHGNQVLFESVSSSFLLAEFKLSSGRAAKLRELGFEKQAGANWSRTFSKSECSQWDVNQIVTQCEEILRDIYAAEGEICVTQRDLQDDHPDNDDLVDCMRAVAQTRSSEARHRMYTALVNATLLVPVDPEVGDDVGDGDEFLIADTLDGHPVFLAFSDWASLRRWSPRGFEYQPVHGSEFFELALSRDLGSVQINPRGEVGGELFRHEVEMLVEGVRNYRKMMMN